MKTQVAPYETRTLCVRIVPVTGPTVRLTTFPRDLTMSNAAVYQAGSGYEFTGYQAVNNLSPSVLDLEGIAGVAGVTRQQIQSGVYDNARWFLFACNWLSPVEDFEPISAGFLGKTTLDGDRYTIEQISMADALNQSVGGNYTALCQKRFGSQGWAGCKKTPTVVTGTLTSVTNQSTVRDSALTQAADFFGEGLIKFTTGNNAGLRPLAIKSHLANGTLTVHEPFFYLPQVGDAYEVTEGCRHRQSDCMAKNNILNFGGDPAIPTISQYVNRGGSNRA